MKGFLGNGTLYKEESSITWRCEHSIASIYVTIIESDFALSSQEEEETVQQQEYRSFPEIEREQNWRDDAVGEEKKLRKEIRNKGENM